MPHLYSFRQGWQSENIANAILSEFSFVSQPTNVSNDIGIDFFCTLFKIVRHNQTNQLYPKLTISIQIKSSRKKVNLSKQITGLEDFRLPYFIGVVSKAQKALTLFSGEALPYFYSKYSSAQVTKPVYAKLEDNRVNPRNMVNETATEIEIIFPRVCRITIMDKYFQTPTLIDDLLRVASIIQGNISSTVLKEFYFLTPDVPQLEYILANSKALPHFRLNFVRRLGEYLAMLDIVRANLPAGNAQMQQLYQTEEQEILDLYDALYALYQQLFGQAAGGFPTVVANLRAQYP